MKCDKCGYCMACEGLEECPNCGPTAEMKDEERRQSVRDEQVDFCARSHYKSLSGA